MVPPPRAGSFSPNPAQNLQTGSIHSPHAAALSAGASPSTSSPTGTSSLTKIVVAQVYLLLSTIKEDKDRAKFEAQVDQLRKLIDEHGMEVFSKYFTRLVAGNAPQIFPGLNRPVANPGNYGILTEEMQKIAHDIDQASKIAESIEGGTEDIFRDFDLSTFMEHFKLDPLQKTLLALAFKLGSRSDLRTKADAILSANFSSFVELLSRTDKPEHADLSPAFVALIIDRLLQYHPPSFNASSRRDLAASVSKRYAGLDQAPPSEVLAALDVGRVVADRPVNALARYIQKTGVDFTKDEETCISYLQARLHNVSLSPEQVAPAVTYATISTSPQLDVGVLVKALSRVLPKSFDWMEVVSLFDQPSARISSPQLLRLYNALLVVADQPGFDIQRLWGGTWNEPEALLSYVCAYASHNPDQLDASKIPGLIRSISLTDYANSAPTVQARAAVAIKHPLISVSALTSIFTVALSSMQASQSVEAKRLFQEVVVPNLDIFLVSAFEVPRPWANMAVDTVHSLFENFLQKRQPHHEFVLDSLWRKDKEWVINQLADTHSVRPLELPTIFEHALQHQWLDELVYRNTGFGLDLAAMAHAEGYLDLTKWARFNADRSQEYSRSLLQFLMIKANMEMQEQRPPPGEVSTRNTTSLQVRTVAALLQILEDFLPKAPMPELILVQRACITAYPRLINYGEGFDDIIDANGRDGNGLPPAANSKMEEHYKRMYGDETQVRNIVDILDRYKHSRDPLDQDVFADMIHGLFDEYNHYGGYPLEALATTAVLFGGIISHKLISDLPLKIGLGMILEAVRDHAPSDPMYKFGLQALMQLLARFREWPGFCTQLLQIPGLQGTEAFKKAEEVVRDHEEEQARNRNGASTPHAPGFGGDTFANGNAEETSPAERQVPAFASINFEPLPQGANFEEPAEDAQDKIHFVLNNLTEGTLQSMCAELRDMMEARHQQWFASHLVEQRAKMQPNYHHVYLQLVKMFQDNNLWSQVLRETYISTARMLNAEATMQNSTERTHLKNLGGWLGLLTLARDRPIKHKNIAFKQLLMEAHDTKRLIVVIPFVCKVLMQGANSAVFRPPNPWLMDIIHLLIELYHHAELKLNLKFEIEVLCKGLNLDHKSIEPSGEILNRPAAAEDPIDTLPQEQLDAFDNLSLNGLAGAVGPGMSPPTAPATLPDLGPLITVPPINEMVVSSSRLHEIVRTALTRALQDIIQPVVDRSVTIAAISTQQMVHKDFVTEPDENRVRTSAVNMVKATAGSLALVTSKEPLRANFTNYMRNLSTDLPSGLPEGTIIMCVNSNLDLACNIIEKQAEERAVPEIEDMIEPELEARRRHRLQHPNEPFYDHTSTNRWSLTIPNPYKLSPSLTGLNPEQMAIYEDFARQPRSTAPATGASHNPSASDTTRSMANEVLQDGYMGMPNVPTPAETPSVPHLNAQMQSYPPVHGTSAGNISNGRSPGFQMDVRKLADRVNNLLQELLRVTGETAEEHFAALPRPHPVIDLVDALVQLIIKTSQSSEEFAIYTVEQISTLMFQQVDDSLTLESLVHVLETLRKIFGPSLNSRVRALFASQPGSAFLSLPLMAALVRTDLLDWRNIDLAMSAHLEARKEGSLEFLDHMLDLALLNNRPIAFFADFVRTLESSWAWIADEPNNAVAQRLKAKLIGSNNSAAEARQGLAQQEQFEYVFEEWVHLYHNQNATEKAPMLFIQQLQSKRVIRSSDDFLVFVRISCDMAIERFEQMVQTGLVSEAYVAIDALAKLISLFITMHSNESAASSRAGFLDSVLALITLIINHHHVRRGVHMTQRPFYRLLSVLLHEVHAISEDVPEEDGQAMVLKFARRFASLGPSSIPSFAFAWIALLSHRAFLPQVMQMSGNAGWEAMGDLVTQLLENLGEQLKAPEVSLVAKDLYRATFKLVAVLQHDFPDFVAALHLKFISALPPHCTQLMNIILAAAPHGTQLPDPTHPGLRIERLEEMRLLPTVVDESATVLAEAGLLPIIDQAIQNGPSEDIVAQLVHAITQTRSRETLFGRVPVGTDIRITTATVLYLGYHAAQHMAQGDGLAALTGEEPELATLSLLVRELTPEARYFALSTVVNELRFPNAHTDFFSQAILFIFGKEMHDPEANEIREQITRIFLERLAGFWPTPWGLLCTIVELIKNEKYMFFDLPFIKTTPDIAERFAAVMQRQ